MAHSPVPTSEAAEVRPQPDLNLLFAWPQTYAQKNWVFIVSASLHVVFFFFAIQLSSFVTEEHPQRAVVVIRTPLYLPTELLTQREPNKGKLTKRIDLDSLLASRRSESRRSLPSPSSRRFESPKQFKQPVAKVQPPQPVQPKILEEAPKLALNAGPTSIPPGVSSAPIAPAPPPPTPASNPFQNIGSDRPTPVTKPAITPPVNTMQSVIQGLAKDPNSRRIVITDDTQSVPRPGSAGTSGLAGNQHAGVELKSDPQGADLRPYLAQILTIVRANWRRVIPESATMGRLRGRTTIEFALDRDGRVVKLVIADPSGSQPLDTASVAGLSMSNPLPPLPETYKGLQLRLAFTFGYNMPSQ